MLIDLQNITLSEIILVSSLLPSNESKVLAHYDITRQQAILLYLVYNDMKSKGKTKLSNFALLLNVSKSTLTRNIEKLEKKNLLKRVILTSSKSLALTSKGQLIAISVLENSSDEIRDKLNKISAL